LAVIVEYPAVTPVELPLLSMVATAVLAEPQEKVTPLSSVPNASLATAKKLLGLTDADRGSGWSDGNSCDWVWRDGSVGRNGSSVGAKRQRRQAKRQASGETAAASGEMGSVGRNGSGVER